MFHVKHNNKYNILHVHIGDRTRRRTRRRAQAHAQAQAGSAAPAAPAAPSARPPPRTRPIGSARPLQSPPRFGRFGCSRRSRRFGRFGRPVGSAAPVAATDADRILPICLLLLVLINRVLHKYALHAIMKASAGRPITRLADKVLSQPHKRQFVTTDWRYKK